MSPPHALRLAAATVLVAAAGVVLPAAPAAAAPCSSETGVSVVVDFSGAGDGGIQSACVADGGGDAASSLFGAAGHTLTRVQSQLGAVCKVDGVRESDQCAQMPPAHAYWGLFWSDGSGGWVYSNEGVDGLNVPDGGSVAFAWQDGGAQDAPGVAPPQTQAGPSASPTPSGGGTGGSGGGPGSGGGGAGTGGNGGATTTPSAPQSGSPTGTPADGVTSDPEQGDRTGPGKRARDEGARKRSGQKRDGKKDRGPGQDEGDTDTEPSADESTTTVPVVTADPPGASDDGLPVWVAPAGIACLFGIAGIVALLRRRSMA